MYVFLCQLCTKKEKMARKYYDIIKNDDENCTILLYGYIGRYDDVSSAVVAQELMEAVNQYAKIDVRVNSMGGEVYEGIAIFNALRNCKAEVTIFIDGIAASAASFVAACGRKVLMGKYSKLMIHEPSGGCYGNKEDMAKCIKELTDIENDLINIYASRCKKSTAEIKNEYFDGKDHWLTADEAVSQGMADGIFDTDPVEGDEPKQIYTTIYNRLEEPQNKNTMSILEELKKSQRFKDCKTEEDALKIVASLEKNGAENETLKAKAAALEASNKKFAEAEAARDAAEKKAILDAAEGEGRIDAETRPTYATLLDKDRELGEKIISQLPKSRRAVEDIKEEVHEVSNAWNERQKEISQRYYGK